MEEKKRILIVDDYDEARKVLSLFVTRFGYEPLEARDGFEALTQAAAEHPDLILMDLLMPRMDGETTIARLKADPVTRNTPILVLTASNRGPLLTGALRAGASEVLSKPIDFKNLQAILGRYLAAEKRAGTAPQELPLNNTKS